MKRFISYAAIALTIAGLAGCNNQSKNDKHGNVTQEFSVPSDSLKEPVMGLGNLMTEHFTGKAWNQPLTSQPEYDCAVYNVTFAPGTRNYWHSHGIGQILLCTEGVGFYQEKGKPARCLVSGDVVNIPANTVHWHGAAPDSRFTHIGITPKMSENPTEWFGEVTNDEYDNATSSNNQ
ncbi:cupin domain-containing protein [Bacteroides acidifaciens]|uniref:cupin domain-containing protein n=1 Tax=Bacteroides acidifaciens TaxID=85831 RepID=UPI0025965D32|nr:cupin domain-containing protein [Bacteroides acidifaciens]